MPGPVTDARAYELRRLHLELYGGNTPPAPIEAIAQDYLGLAVVTAELGEISGLLYPSDRTIFLNAAEPEVRQRFTLAHEIGHWVCQCLAGEREPVYCRADDVNLDPQVKQREREANVFAAELLMPEPELRAAWHVAPLPDNLAAMFGVSSEAMRWRLYNLGLAPDPPDRLGAPHTRA